MRLLLALLPGQKYPAMLVDPMQDSMISGDIMRSVAAETGPQSLLKFHLRQEELLNLKLQQMALIRKTGNILGRE